MTDSDDDLGDYDYAETSSDSNESLSSSSEEDNEDEQESGGSQEANKLQLQKRARKGRFLTNKKSKKAKKDQAKQTWNLFQKSWVLTAILVIDIQTIEKSEIRFHLIVFFLIDEEDD